MSVEAAEVPAAVAQRPLVPGTLAPRAELPPRHRESLEEGPFPVPFEELDDLRVRLDRVVLPREAEHVVEPESPVDELPEGFERRRHRAEPASLAPVAPQEEDPRIALELADRAGEEGARRPPVDVDEEERVLAVEPADEAEDLVRQPVYQYNV